MSHTPAPWILEISPTNMHYIKRNDNQCIATVHTMADGKNNATLRVESEANARLIAVAPELLEALDGMLLMFEKVSDKVNWGSTFLGAEEIRLMNEKPIEARTAIAKAKGQS